MKRIIEAILIIIILVTPNMAKEKTNQPYDMKANSEVANTKSFEETVLQIEVSERMITTGIIITEIIILLSILYYWKRTREDKIIASKNIYKNNIKAIRNERIIPFRDNKTANKRRKLQKIINTQNLNGSTIANISKKLDVAKGELFLAAKIQQLQNQAR
jgi:archaellum component FlaF (FlaF/FlaG flagellin family)